MYRNLHIIESSFILLKHTKIIPKKIEYELCNKGSLTNTKKLSYRLFDDHVIN